MLPKHSQKTFSVYKFSSKHVFVWCKKKHLHCTISWHPRTTFLKQMSVYFCISWLEYFCFKGVVRFHLVVWRVGGGWIIFLRQLTVWVFQNVFQFFILIEIFRYSTIFHYFDTFISIETLKSFRQLGLQK